MVVVVPILILSVFGAVVVNAVVPDEGKQFSLISSIEDETSVANGTSSELELANKRVNAERTDSRSGMTLEEATTGATDRTNSDALSNRNMSSSPPLIHITEGRPHFPDLFSQASFRGARRPAVFVCGPKSLIQSARAAVRCCGGSLVPGGGFSCGHVAVYEEAFEL